MAACISTQLQACNGGTTPIPQSRNENALAPLSSCAGTNVPAQPVTQGTLRGVTAFSNTSAFAVGFRLSTSGIGLRTLIEQFNGTTWSIVSTPNPGANSDQVDGAGGSAPNDVWAVGSQRLVTNGQAQTLILHYNGSTWSVVASPTQLSMIGGALLAVAARSTSDAWAAGRYTRSDNTSHLLVEHWNGSKWSIVSAPDVGASSELDGITKAGSVSYMVVGYSRSTTNTDHPLTELWNGSSWKIESIPSGFTNEVDLYAASGVSATDLWAAGASFVPNDHPIALHWNGSAWTGYVLPDPSAGAGADLYGIAEPSISNAWAVGQVANKLDRSFAEHWNGVGWSIAPVAHPVTTGDDFNGAAPIPGTANAWAVGDMILSNGASTPLTETLHC